MNELAAAFMAKLVSGNLQTVDEATTHRSATSGPANKINAHNFISNKSAQNLASNTSVTEQMQNIIEQPINRTDVYVSPQVATAAASSKRKVTTTKDNKHEIALTEDFLTVFKSIDKTLKSIASEIKIFNKSK
jgi:hypothetical protein